MAIQPGALTSDQVPLEALRTDIIGAIRQHNESDATYKDLLCKVTTDETVRVLQNPKQFERGGSDTGAIPMQRHHYQDISLPKPDKRVLGSGIAQDAVDQGITSEQVYEEHQSSIEADKNLIQECCMAAMLLDGGWWDASATPPAYKMNTHTSSHDHYLAYNVSGVPTFAHVSAAKLEIQHHGAGLAPGSLTMLINGAQAKQLEDYAALNTAPGPMPTAMLERLQKAGLTPNFEIDVEAIKKEDWVPENYAVMFDHTKPPLWWRTPKGRAKDGKLQFYRTQDQPDYYWEESYVRYVSAKVGLRGAGVGMYFGGASWTDPTFNFDFPA